MEFRMDRQLHGDLIGMQWIEMKYMGYWVLCQAHLKEAGLTQDQDALKSHNP